MKIGKKYKVVFSDCCINGSLIGTLLKKDVQEYGVELTFDTGKIWQFSEPTHKEIGSKCNCSSVTHIFDPLTCDFEP